MPKKKKSKLQKKKENPKSTYWKNKADKLWGEVMHLSEECAVGIDCAGSLEAHHLISRGNVCTRHNIENGILLCSKHHKFGKELSAHLAPLAFSEWLQKECPEKWAWCSENKYKLGKPDYEAAYLRLEKQLEDMRKEGMI